MKRLAKMLAVTCVAALALAVSATGASAATFTASATGEVTGAQTSTQVFKVTSTGSNEVTCKKAVTSGKITSTASTEQHVTVKYSECEAHFFFFSFPATISDATYKFTADGTVHIENTITIKVPDLGCETIVGPQTVSSATYANKTGGKLEVTSDVGGIVSSSPDGCPEGTTGTYTGSNLVERVGGGSISWDK